MTEENIIQAISVNLLRMSEWYYKDPKNNLMICERYLIQSKKLATQVTSTKVKKYINQIDALSISSQESPERIAERFLTLGVLLHQL